MKHKKQLHYLLILLLFGIISCKDQQKTKDITAEEDPKKEKGLKDYFAEDFPMGVAVSPASLEGKSKELILAEYNSLTPENVMKMGIIHPKKDEFNWAPADKIVAFAQENGLKVRGHALVWHQQTGDWIFKDDKGNDVSREVLLDRMKAHIDSVVGRYKGKIYAWDVVNEAIDDNPQNFLRNSKWLEIIGDDFLTKAFEFAHAADPNAKLFYNDYNIIIPEKRDRVLKLIDKLKAEGAPINGIGIQGHWSVFNPSEEELQQALKMYTETGLDVQITELDVSLYKWEKEQRERRPGDSDEFTEERKLAQIEAYQKFFKVFREYRDKLTGITFWNIADRYSWLDHYPVEGRKNYPLLFDENYQRKQVYDSVIKFSKK